MQSILEDIRTEAEKLWQAGIHEAETILRKAEEAIGMHKAAANPPSIPGIEVTEGMQDDCAVSLAANAQTVCVNAQTTAEATLAVAGAAGPAGDAEVLASLSADAAPAAEAAPAASDPAPAA